MVITRKIKLFLVLAILLCAAICTTAKGKSILEFNLETGSKYSYKIAVDFTQRTIFETAADQISRGEVIELTGNIIWFETIFVAQNYNNDYAAISCRVDSLTANLKSSVDSVMTEIKIHALKDSIVITHNDSVLSVYDPEHSARDAASDLYERLLFVGEDIKMLVYPDGEIINITENKNLWQLMRELLALPDEGFLEVVLPQTQPKWEQTIEIDRLGDFELKDKPKPLVMNYRLSPVSGQLDFSGGLFIRNLTSQVTIPGLDDEISLTLDNYAISKEGSALFSSNAGTLRKLEYTVSRNGNLMAKDVGQDQSQIDLRSENNTRVQYQLLP
jgi:hypothetical protein